jgi:MoaA/NifB/PqqE/SkfB family radical SAM enzyme
MQLVRGVVNAMLSRGLPHLKEAPPETVRTAYEYLRRIGLRCGFPMPEELDDRFLRNAFSLVARAVINTPYGQPLQLESPLIITLSVSDYCPFACTNCYSNSGQTSTNERPADGVQPIFEKVADSTTPFVLITGGEPLATQSTRPGVLALLDAGKRVLISTNASIATYLDIAERYPTTLTFVLPIWGTRKRHDELRGHRSFERVEQNLELLNRRGLRGHLMVVLADDSFSVFEDVLRLVQKLEVSIVRVVRKIRVGRRDDIAIEVSSGFEQALRQRTRQLRRYVPHVLIDIPELRRRRPLKAIQSVLGIRDYGSCAAGRWMMHIDSRGAAFPCYTFEPSGRHHVPSTLSIFDQWRLIQLASSDLGSGNICIGEESA